MESVPQGEPSLDPHRPPGPPKSPPPSSKSLAAGISASKQEVPQEELNLSEFQPASVEKLKKQLRTVRRIQRRYAPQKASSGRNAADRRGSKTGPPPPFPPPPVAYDLNKPPGLPLSVIMQTPPPPATPPPEMLISAHEDVDDGQKDGVQEEEEEAGDSTMSFKEGVRQEEKKAEGSGKEEEENEGFVYNYDETVMTVKKTQYEQQAASVEQQYAKYQTREEASLHDPAPVVLPRYNVDDTVVNVAAGASIVAANDVHDRLSQYEASTKTLAGREVERKREEAPVKTKSNYDEAETVMTVERGYTRNAFEKVVSTYQPEPSPPATTEADAGMAVSPPGFSVDDTTMTVQRKLSSASLAEVVKRYTPPLEDARKRKNRTEDGAGEKDVAGFDEAGTVMTVERGYTRNAFEEVVSTYQPKPSPQEDEGVEETEVKEREEDAEVTGFSLDDTVVTVQKGFSNASVEEVVERYTPPPKASRSQEAPVSMTREKVVYDDDKTFMTIQKGFSKDEVEEVLKTYRPVARDAATDEDVAVSSAEVSALEEVEISGIEVGSSVDDAGPRRQDNVLEGSVIAGDAGGMVMRKGEEDRASEKSEEDGVVDVEDEDVAATVGEEGQEDEGGTAEEGNDAGMETEGGVDAATETSTVKLDDSGDTSTQEDVLRGEVQLSVDSEQETNTVKAVESDPSRGRRSSGSGIEASASEDTTPEGNVPTLAKENDTAKSLVETTSAQDTSISLASQAALRVTAKVGTAEEAECEIGNEATTAAQPPTRPGSESEERRGGGGSEDADGHSVSHVANRDQREKSISEYSGYEATAKSETTLTDDDRVTSAPSEDAVTDPSESGSAFEPVGQKDANVEALPITEERLSSVDEREASEYASVHEETHTASRKASTSSGGSSRPGVYFNYDDTVANVAKLTPEATKDSPKDAEEEEEVMATFNYEETVMTIDAAKQQRSVETLDQQPTETTVRFDYDETVMKINREPTVIDPAAKDPTEKTTAIQSSGEAASDRSESVESDQGEDRLLSHEEQTGLRAREDQREDVAEEVGKSTGDADVSPQSGPNTRQKVLVTGFQAEVSDAESMDSALRKPPSISGATADVRDMYAYRTDSEATKKPQRRVKRVSFSEEETSTIASRKASVAESKDTSKSSSSAEDQPLVERAEGLAGEGSVSLGAQSGSSGTRSSSSAQDVSVSDHDDTGEGEKSGSILKPGESLASVAETPSATSGAVERERDYADSSSLSRSDSQAPSVHPVSSKSSSRSTSEAKHSASEAQSTTIASASSEAEAKGDELKEVESQSAPLTQSFVLLPPSQQKPLPSKSSKSSSDASETSLAMMSESNAETPLDKAVAPAAGVSSSSGSGTTTGTSTSGEESEEIFGPPPAVPPPPTKPPPPSTAAPGFAEVVPPRQPPPGYFTYNYPPQLEEQERLKNRMRQALRERNRALMLERSAQKDDLDGDGTETFSIDGLREKRRLHYVLLNVLRREWSERIEVQQYYSTTVRKLRNELETSDRAFTGVVPLPAFRHALHKCLGFKQRDVNRIVCFLGTKQGLVPYSPLVAALEDFANELMDGALVNAKPPLVAGKQNPSVIVYAALDSEHIRAKMRQFARWINGLKGFRDRQMDLGVLLEGISDGGLLYNLVSVLEQRRNRHFRFRTKPRTAIERIEMALRHVGLQAPRSEQLFRGELKAVLSLLGHLLSTYVFQKPRHFQKVLSWFNEVLVCYGKDVPLQLMREPHRGLWATFGGGDTILCVLHYFLGTAVVDLSSVYENPISAEDIKSNWYKVSRLLLKCGLPVPLTMKEILSAKLSNQDMLLLMLFEVRNRFKSSETALTPSSFRTIQSPGTKQRRKQIVNVYFKGEDKVFSSSRDYLSDADVRKHQLRRKYIAQKLCLGESIEENKEVYTDCLSGSDSASLSSEDLRDIEQELSSYFRVKRRFSVSLEGSLEPCVVYVENGELGPNIVWDHVHDMDRNGYVALEDIAMCEMCTESTDERMHYILIRFQHGYFSAIQSSGGYKQMRVYCSYESGDEAYDLHDSKERDLLRFFASLLKLLENRTTLTLAI